MMGQIKCWLGWHRWGLWKVRFLEDVRLHRDARRDRLYRCRRPGCEAERIQPNYVLNRHWDGSEIRPLPDLEVKK